MILFVSDIHFGRRDAATERRVEADLLTCLTEHGGADGTSGTGRVERLYLLGDVFEQYIEHRHLVPKGFVRFQALLARWTDAGVPVTYLVGNHDPWHRDYFTRELGVEVRFDAFAVWHYGRCLHLAHGDAVAASSDLYPRIRPLLRHPWAVWAYRTLVPADAGYALARWYSRRRHAGQPPGHTDPKVVRGLRAHARRRLATCDAVVMGHSHAPRLHAWRDGCYLNLGNWYHARTFGRLDPPSPDAAPFVTKPRLRLMRWNGSRAVDIETTLF